MSSNDTLGYPFLRHQIEIIIIPWIAKINTEPLTNSESNLIFWPKVNDLIHDDLIVFLKIVNFPKNDRILSVLGSYSFSNDRKPSGNFSIHLEFVHSYFAVRWSRLWTPEAPQGQGQNFQFKLRQFWPTIITCGQAMVILYLIA